MMLNNCFHHFIYIYIYIYIYVSALVISPRHQPWILESSIFNFVKVKDELSLVLGISDLSGRRVQWGFMTFLGGALGGHELHDTIIRRLQYFGISSARERAEVFIFNMALIFSFGKLFILANLSKTICNAHPTARRFPKGGSHSARRFGCFAVGDDCVFHYPFCPGVLSSISGNFGGLLLSDLSWAVNFYIPHCFLLEKVFIGILFALLYGVILSHIRSTPGELLLLRRRLAG